MTRCTECQAQWDHTTHECPACGSRATIEPKGLTCGRCGTWYANMLWMLTCYESHPKPLLPETRPIRFPWKRPVPIDYGTNVGA